LRGKDRGDYIKSISESFRQERTNQRDEGVAQRAEELKKEIPEGIEKLKKLGNLPPCVHEGEIMQNFAKVLNVASKNILVMATEADAIQIMKTKAM